MRHARGSRAPASLPMALKSSAADRWSASISMAGNTVTSVSACATFTVATVLNRLFCALTLNVPSVLSLLNTWSSPSVPPPVRV